MKTEHRFRLLDNALDYVLSAAEHAADKKPRSLKYAVLHLFAGLELLLKARLRREHWALLFSNLDDASRASLTTGDFKSVEFDVAVKRLTRIAEVEIVEHDLKTLRSLRDLRNRIQHFDFKINEPHVQAMVGRTANFVIEFVKTNLDGMHKRHTTQLKRIREALHESDAYVKARLNAIGPKLKSVKNVAECPHCLQDTLPLSKKPKGKCLFCDETVVFADLAHDRSETGEVFECPDCGQDSCSPILVNNDEMRYRCTACGTMFNPKLRYPCPECNHVLIKKGDGLCSQCYKDKVDSND